MRLRRRARTRGRFGRTLIEIDYASAVDGQMPVAYLPAGASAEQHVYARDWLRAVQTPRGVSVDAFIPRKP